MSADQKQFGQINKEIIQYAYETFRPEDPVLQEARAIAERRGLPAISLGAFDALHLEVIVRAMGAKKGVEIGTLGGYSGVALARGMGAGGKLHTFELDLHHAEVARQVFDQAQLMTEVSVHVGPALENLPTIASEAPFDFVFIDADKINYPVYLDWATDHLRVGGLVIADNTFGFGKIHQSFHLSEEERPAVMGLREFNSRVANSNRFRATILPTGEGLTIAVKIS